MEFARCCPRYAAALSLLPLTASESAGSARLAVSLEFYPNKVIESCPFNYGWIESCYGRQAAKAIARHVVSCSGVTLGARNSILVYVC